METTIKDRFLMKFKKKNTIKTYDTQIELFYNYICNHTEEKFDTDLELLKILDYDKVEDYFYYIDREKGYRKATINNKIEILKEFFDYVVKRKDIEGIEYNYTDTIDMYGAEEIKNDKKKKYIPSPNEVKRIIEATYIEKFDSRNWEFNSARDRFLIALLSTTGLRINEALDIRMWQIESVDGGYMININAIGVKNNINKRVPIVESIIKYFEEYKLQRMIMNENFNTDLLFFSSRGNKMNSANVDKKLKIMAQDAKLEKKISCHCFRHFLTMQLKASGTDISLIYKILGWSEKNIDSNYDGEANDKRYDHIKLKVCNVLAG